MEPIIPALISTFGVIIGAIITRPNGNVPVDITSNNEGVSPVKITMSLPLAIFGLIAWLIPPVALTSSLIGMAIGMADLTSSTPKKFCRTGIWLNIIVLMAAVANAAIGAYMGYNGELSF